MAKATTQKFEHMTLELETAVPDTYAKPCGILGVTVTRTVQIDENEVPDCADESLPLEVERDVRRIDVKVSGNGVWALESHQEFLDWFYSGATKNIRVGSQLAASGETQYEQGPALLTQLDYVREKGKKVVNAITIEFSGTPTRVAAP